MDNASILCWNVRGLNARARRDAVRTLIDDLRPTIVCLQETKLLMIDCYMLMSILRPSYVKYAYLPAPNTSGGILIAGRTDSVSLTDVLIGCFSVTLRVSMAEYSDLGPWWLTSVYGPQENGDKALFLEELEAIRDACTGP